MSTLVVLAHPSFAPDRVEGHVRGAHSGSDRVTIHDLYSAYPTHQLDPDLERRLVAEHDHVVLPIAMHWHPLPRLLTQWTESIFGVTARDANALSGKSVQAAVSVSPDAQRFVAATAPFDSADDLLRPLRTMVESRGMRWQPPRMIGPDSAYTPRARFASLVTI